MLSQNWKIKYGQLVVIGPIKNLQAIDLLV